MTTTTLIVLGVGPTPCGLVGCGIEFAKDEDPSNPQLWERIAVCILGGGLLLVGFRPEFSVADRNLPEVQEPPPVAISPPQPPTFALAGKLNLLHHADAFRDRRTDYSMTASLVPTKHGSSLAEIDAQGHFRIPGILETPFHTVFWGVSRPSEFVIWPLAYSRIQPGDELAFRFERLGDRFIAQKGRMLAAVTNGEFAEAQEQLEDLLQLFDLLGTRGTAAPIAETVARWRFTIHRDLVHAAVEFRARRGRSRVTHEQVLAEREWRRAMISASLEQAGSGPATS